MTQTDTSEVVEPPLTQQLTRIDQPMERKRVGDMVVNKFAGLTFQEYRECIEFAKLMSQAKHSVPAYLKENAGDCLAIIVGLLACSASVRSEISLWHTAKRRLSRQDRARLAEIA